MGVNGKKVRGLKLDMERNALIQRRALNSPNNKVCLLLYTVLREGYSYIYGVTQRNQIFLRKKYKLITKKSVF